MAEVLAAVALVLVVMLLAVVLVTVLTFRSLGRRNRVSPDQPSGAPLHWLGSPQPAARLHRRLRETVRLLRTAVPPPRKRSAERSPIQALALEVEQHAAALDRDLVLAAHLRGAARRHALAELAHQVAEVERLAGRVARAAVAGQPARAGAEPTASAIGRLHAELDTLEAARDEIARLEQAAGLPPASAPPSWLGPPARAPEPLPVPRDRR